MHFRSVDLPTPLFPRIAIEHPSSASNDTFFKHRRAAAILKAQIPYAQHALLFPLNSKYKNSGPPRNDVIAPIGS